MQREGQQSSSGGSTTSAGLGSTHAIRGVRVPIESTTSSCLDINHHAAPTKQSRRQQSFPVNTDNRVRGVEVTHGTTKRACNP